MTTKINSPMEQISTFIGSLSDFQSTKDHQFFVPDKNVAIDYYEFSTGTKKAMEKSAINSKALKCIENGTKLLQIFEDEWLNQQEICKSMIEHRLGISPNRVFARKCEVVEMSGHESATFFDQSHLAGSTRAKIHFGLKYNGVIIAGLSLRKPVQKNKDKHLTDGIIEIARYATLPHHHVSGGFGKLFKVAKDWAKREGYKKILTYADLRVGEGKVYFNNNFFYKGRTASVMYWYVKTNVGSNPEKYKELIFGKRYFRFKFRAQPGLTEKQVAEEAGVEKLYGTVNNSFEMAL